MTPIKNLLPAETLTPAKMSEFEALKQKYPRTFEQVAHLPAHLQFSRLRVAQIADERGDYHIADEFFQQTPLRVPATDQMIAEHFGLKALNALTTSHMNPEQAKLFSGVIGRVYDWKREVKKEPSRSFILSSRFVGIGKTHIAEAICDGFRLVWTQQGQEPYFVNGKPDFHMTVGAKLVTSREFMEEVDKGDYTNEGFLPHRFTALVLDDVGREGSIKFEKRDEQSQQAEKQARYFHLIDHLYKTRRAALFITSNLTLEELADFFGPATWSRLKELCTFRYLVEIKTELPDMRVVKAKG